MQVCVPVCRLYVYLCVCLCSSPTAAHLVLCFLLAISEEVKKGVVVLRKYLDQEAQMDLQGIVL